MDIVRIALARSGQRGGVFLRQAILILLLGLVLVSPSFAQMTLNASPAVKVESGPKGTERVVLSDPDREKNRVVVSKVNGRYVWVSRDNRELTYQASGAFHMFIDLRGGGYVKVFDTHKLPESLRDPGPRFQFMEHVTQWLGTITYWGSIEHFEL